MSSEWERSPVTFQTVPSSAALSCRFSVIPSVFLNLCGSWPYVASTQTTTQSRHSPSESPYWNSLRNMTSCFKESSQGLLSCTSCWIHCFNYTFKWGISPNEWHKFGVILLKKWMPGKLPHVCFWFWLLPLLTSESVILIFFMWQKLHCIFFASGSVPSQPVATTVTRQLDKPKKTTHFCQDSLQLLGCLLAASINITVLLAPVLEQTLAAVYSNMQL